MTAENTQPHPFLPFSQTRAALDEVAWARAVYDGRRTNELGPEIPPLADVLKATGGNITWPEFQRWVSLVASYAFHLPDDAGTSRAVFLPLLDLLNHGDADVANCDVGREGAAFVARATKAIKAGDEVSFSYSWGQARPDHQFMHYGFLNRARRAAPHLACVDLFNKTIWDCPAPDDEELGKKGKCVKGVAQLARRRKNKRTRTTEGHRFDHFSDFPRSAAAQNPLHALTDHPTPLSQRRAPTRPRWHACAPFWKGSPPPRKTTWHRPKVSAERGAGLCDAGKHVRRTARPTHAHCDAHAPLHRTAPCQRLAQSHDHGV